MDADELAKVALTYLHVAMTFPSGSHGRAANWSEAAKYLNLAAQRVLLGEVITGLPTLLSTPDLTLVSS